MCVLGISGVENGDVQMCVLRMSGVENEDME